MEYACTTGENPFREFCQFIEDDEPVTDDEALMYLWSVMFTGTEYDDEQPYRNMERLKTHVTKLITNHPVPEIKIERDDTVWPVVLHQIERLLKIGTRNGAFKSRQINIINTQRGKGEFGSSGSH